MWNREIITKHAKESKFGFILTPESFRDLADDLYNLLATSRSLKAAGDKLLATGPSNARVDGATRGIR